MGELNTIFKKISKDTKKILAQDKSTLIFWSKYFPNKEETSLFIQNCLKKLLTRRMMLRVEWYADIADGMSKVRDGRPALQVVFLIALAESIVKSKITKKQADILGSQKLVLNFFKHIANSDKKELREKFQRALISTSYHTLLLSSVIRILYQVRNDVLHGGEYWNFSLVDKKYHKEIEGPYWSLLTSGQLGKTGRKRHVTLNIKLTYENLKDIFIRTAIQNIKSKF